MSEPQPFAALTRESLGQYLRQPLRAGGGTRPELALLEDGGGRRDACAPSSGRQAVLKDYRASGWLMRRWVGPWLIGREERIYRLLDGVAGIPRLVCRLDRQALLVEHIAGRSCAEYPDRSLPAEFFDRLREVVEGIHARGVVHCDIKNRSNIVVGEDGQPYVIDFASAFARQGRWFPFRRLLFERFRVDDLRGVAKAKVLVARAGTREEAHFAFHRGPLERVVRAIRDAGRWVFRVIVRK